MIATKIQVQVDTERGYNNESLVFMCKNGMEIKILSSYIPGDIQLPQSIPHVPGTEL